MLTHAHTPVSARTDAPTDTVLHCHSHGDKRYSALYAHLKCGWTIEQVYQGAKRHTDGSKYTKMKGQLPEMLLIGGQLYPHTYALRHELYLSLWFLYFTENPHLLLEAAQYTEFEDKFSWNGRKIHWTESYPAYTHNGKQLGCNQASAIAYMVNRYRCGLLEHDPRMSIQDHGGHTQIIYTGNDIVTPWPWLNECIRDAVLAYMGRWMKK